MDLKQFLSDPTLQKDEDNNILCRKIANGKTHHMKPAFCMSARLRSEGWEIVRKPEPPPTNPLYLVDNKTEMAIPLNKFTTSSEKEKPFEIPEPPPPALTPGVLIETQNGTYKIDDPAEAKPKRKYKARKTTTKRKRTVKNLTPEITNG